MTRALVLGILLAAGALSPGMAAAQQPEQPAPMVVEVDTLRDNLFVLRGGGGNSVVFVQTNGVTVVDTKNPGWGQAVLEKIKELTDKPVVRIINTHAHADHVSGNGAFPDNVDIVMHANTAENVKKMAAAPTSVFAQNGGRGLAKRTFTESLTLDSGDDRIELRYFGRGQTNGDAWIIFPALRVMASGDIFAAKGVPNLDYNIGGSGAAIGDSLMKAYTATGTMVDSIVTGHSTVMTPDDLREVAEFNIDFVNMVREGKRAGTTAEQLAKAWMMPAKYQGFALGPAGRVQTNIENISRELP